MSLAGDPGGRAVAHRCVARHQKPLLIQEQFRFLRVFTAGNSGLDVVDFQVILLPLHRRRRQVGAIVRRRNNVHSVLSDDGSAERPLIKSLSRLSRTWRSNTEQCAIMQRHRRRTRETRTQSNSTLFKNPTVANLIGSREKKKRTESNSRL